MEIKDIIKTDKDRLFIVDPECYIIFTGDSTEDIKPFIRIGNWINMPVELIPLVENIIITDNIIGDPSLEQFNIDIRTLSTNRYIGSRHIVKRFLDYQKIFGLDLTNASIVDIEKDIPELSKEKKISTKNQFIGVFYRDGNFKTTHNSKAIFDLKKISEEPINYLKIHNHISEKNKNSKRYTGAGMVLIEHNPMFYYKKYFTSYLMPSRYFEDISRLNIDPAKIKTVIYPSRNLINISKLLRWKNNTRGNVLFYSNNSDLNIAKRLFSNCNIRLHDFNRMDDKTDEGLNITQYADSFNIRLTYPAAAPSEEELSIAFVKGTSHIREIIRDDVDALFISYSAFEDMTMVLKSTDIPTAIIDDGNKNISKLKGSGKIIINHGIQYELQKHRGIDSILPIANVEDEIISYVFGNTAALEKYIDSPGLEKKDSFETQKKLFNILSLTRLQLEITTNRKDSARLKSIAGKIESQLKKDILAAHADKFIIIVAIYDKTMCQFMVTADEKGSLLFHNEVRELTDEESSAMKPDVLKYHERIIDDRIRLQNLIDIYLLKSAYLDENKQEIARLKTAIDKRKKTFKNEDLNYNDSGIVIADDESEDAAALAEGKDPALSSGTGSPAERGKKAAAAAAGGKGSTSSKAASPDSEEGGDKRILSIPLKYFIPLVLVLLCGLLFIGYGIYKKSTTVDIAGTKVIQSQEIDDKYSKLGEENNIHIRNADILKYANQVAVNNGYHRIAETGLKEKNPDWIYPENIFHMLDGQRVIVSTGDTLWNLSKNKLIEMTLNFKTLMEKYKDAPESEKLKVITEAKKYTFIKEHNDIVQQLYTELLKRQTGDKNDKR